MFIKYAIRTVLFAGVAVASLTATARAQQTIPASVAAPGTSAVMTAHGVGAQIYECVTDTAGKRTWQFREPIATLLSDGHTVGRHFAGPSWELSDGSLIVGKVVGHAPGATANDIPWLKLEPANGPGSGRFASVTIIQRLNTKGGALTGGCDNAGGLIAVPYASDYMFLKPGP